MRWVQVAHQRNEITLYDEAWSIRKMAHGAVEQSNVHPSRNRDQRQSIDLFCQSRQQPVVLSVSLLHESW